jgi:hypothetical protein
MVNQTRNCSRGFSITILACTANRPTKLPLFEAILQCDWTNAYNFLTNGTWTTEDYSDSTLPPRIQARERATYYDNYTQQRLRQLPLHAAIFHLAPLLVVQALVDLYPEAVRVHDSQGNLPLHLAFMTNAKDVFSFLLRLFPEGLMAANQEGRLPIECYHHLFHTIMAESESHIDEAEARDQKELQVLELQVAKDEQQMITSEKDLNEIRMQIEKLAGQGERLIRSLMTTEEFRTGSVDL